MRRIDTLSSGMTELLLRLKSSRQLYASVRNRTARATDVPVSKKLPCTELCGCVDCKNSTDENDVPMAQDADTDSEDED